MSEVTEGVVIFLGKEHLHVSVHRLEFVLTSLYLDDLKPLR
jgi:hypothetical protein